MTHNYKQRVSSGRAAQLQLSTARPMRLVTYLLLEQRRRNIAGTSIISPVQCLHDRRVIYVFCRHPLAEGFTQSRIPVCMLVSSLKACRLLPLTSQQTYHAYRIAMASSSAARPFAGPDSEVYREQSCKALGNCSRYTFL